MERVISINQRVEKASSGFTISIESALQVGFNHFRRAPGIFIVYTVIGIIVFSNPASGLILGGPLLVGYYLFARNLQAGLETGTELFFESFTKFIPLLILNLLMSIVILIGFLILVLPGIYFSVSYLFAHLFVWFYDVPPTEAVTLSRKMVSGNFSQIFWLWLILAGINILGAIALGVGLLVTIPFSACVIYAVFDDIIGIP
ncbi:MAG: hypothetical protein GY790_01880 [Bacteroidetes bacterium]|nr:hypothetical protein [Bacteroidota bacterium]